MSEEKVMTDDEKDKVFDLVSRIGDACDNSNAYLLAHALCHILADIGLQGKDRMTKRQFVAATVESLDFWYEKLSEEDDE